MASRQPPLDPRLIRHIRTARAHVIRTVVLGLVEAVCALTLAYSVAKVGADLLIERTHPADNWALLLVAAAALLTRAAATWYGQLTGHRAATATISELRERVIAAYASAGPRCRTASGSSVATLTSAGLENLRPYLTGFVPQLALSATVTPLALTAIALLDVTSALVALIALPLIPVFMILIGKMTVGSSERSLASMRSLWSTTLDLIEGLPTLRAFDRQDGSTALVASLGARHKKASMRTLAFAFLSSFALELIATLGVALIAVSIGLRLVTGSMELFPALAVLVLAAEVYLPLRLVGQQFHASTDGLAALDAAFEIIDREGAAPPHGKERVDLRGASLSLHGVSVPGRDSIAPAGFSAEILPRSITALRGASGQGKSTLLGVILGLISPESGSVTVRTATAETPLSELDLEHHWSQIAWLPQRPIVGPGTLRGILEDALPPGIDPASKEGTRRVLEAAQATGALEHVIDLHGWGYEVGRGGLGLSVGQRQRLALSRALMNPAPLVIMDEPTSHLDGASERMLTDVIARLRDGGSTIVMSAHRDGLLSLADSVYDVSSAPAQATEARA